MSVQLWRGRKNKEVIFRVICSLPDWYRTSQLLMEKLKQHFNFRIVDVISAPRGFCAERRCGGLYHFHSAVKQQLQAGYVVVSPLLRDKGLY